MNRINNLLVILPKGQYRTTIASDKDNDPRQIAVTSGKTKSGRPLKVNLIPGGGYLVKFERIKKPEGILNCEI